MLKINFNSSNRKHQTWRNILFQRSEQVSDSKFVLFASMSACLIPSPNYRIHFKSISTDNYFTHLIRLVGLFCRLPDILINLRKNGKNIGSWHEVVPIEFIKAPVKPFDSESEPIWVLQGPASRGGRVTFSKATSARRANLSPHGRLKLGLSAVRGATPPLPPLLLRSMVARVGQSARISGKKKQCRRVML